MTTAPCPTCGGYGTTIIESRAPSARARGARSARRTIDVDIPAGVETGTRIRHAGHGDAGPGGGGRGDLYLEIREKSHKTFERRGNDLHCTLEIPMTAATLGTVLDVETFDGAREIDVRPGTHAGATITLKGLGVGRLQRNGRGNLYVHLDIQTPTEPDGGAGGAAQAARRAARGGTPRGAARPRGRGAVLPAPRSVQGRDRR